MSPLSDPQYDGMTTEELVAMVPNIDDASAEEQRGQLGRETNEPLYAFLADTMTLTHTDRPLLAVNYFLSHGENFRVTPEALPIVQINLRSPT